MEKLRKKKGSITKKPVQDVSVEIYKNDLGILPLSSYAPIFNLTSAGIHEAVKKKESLEKAIISYQNQYLENARKQYEEIYQQTLQITNPTAGQIARFQVAFKHYEKVSEDYQKNSLATLAEKRQAKKENEKKAGNYEELRQKIIDLTPEKMELIPITEEDRI